MENNTVVFKTSVVSFEKACYTALGNWNIDFLCVNHDNITGIFILRGICCITYESQDSRCERDEVLDEGMSVENEEYFFH